MFGVLAGPPVSKCPDYSRGGGQPFSVLELAERHRGYQGFSPPQADSLMKSTVNRARSLFFSQRPVRSAVDGLAVTGERAKTVYIDVDSESHLAHNDTTVTV